MLDGSGKKVTFNEEQLTSFMQAVNGVRLVLGTILDVTEDDDFEAIENHVPSTSCTPTCPGCSTPPSPPLPGADQRPGYLGEEAVELGEELRPRRLVAAEHVVAAGQQDEPAVGDQRRQLAALRRRDAVVVAGVDDQRRAATSRRLGGDVDAGRRPRGSARRSPARSCAAAAR